MYHGHFKVLSRQERLIMVELGNLASKKLLQHLAYAFRRREIILRSDGKVRYFAISPWMSISGLSVAVLSLIWMAYSSF